MTPLHGEMVDDLPMLQAISDRQRKQLANPEACTMPDDEQRPVPLGKRTPKRATHHMDFLIRQWSTPSHDTPLHA
jgi:hypothetical protein